MRRSAIHSSASARSTVAGTRRATSMAASRRAKRSTWSGHTYDISVRRPSGVVASSGLRSQPLRSATSKRGREVGRVALPHAGEAHRAVRVAAHHPPGVVGEVVPPQVQAGAGADLEDPQRQGGAMRDRRRSRPPAPPTDPPRWSARRPRCSSAISASCSSTVARNVAPSVGAFGAAGRRVVGGEGRRPPLEHDPVHGAEEPQRERGAERVLAAAAEEPRRHAAGSQVVDHRVEHAAVQRRRRLARTPPPGTRRRR